jgi:hypothetical protein
MWEIASRWVPASTSRSDGGRRGAWLALLLACVASATGCHSDAERREQARIAHLAERIDRLRRADNADKKPLLEALEAADCVGPDACALKDLCVRAYQLHQRGLDAIASLRAGAGSADPEKLAQELMRAAEQDLARARDLGAQCSEAQVRTVRKVLM